MTLSHVLYTLDERSIEQEKRKRTTKLAQRVIQNNINDGCIKTRIDRAAIREHSAHFPNEPIAYGRGTSVSLFLNQIDTRSIFFSSSLHYF
jgi:hypothetical protein